MTKKRSLKSAMRMLEGPTKMIRIHLPGGLHAALKILAATNKTTMQNLVDGAVRHMVFTGEVNVLIQDKTGEFKLLKGRGPGHLKLDVETWP